MVLFMKPASLIATRCLFEIASSRRAVGFAPYQIDDLSTEI